MRADRNRPTFLARPGRLVLVADTLAELHGPTGGVVTLPHRMVWQGDIRAFDLDDVDLLRWVYEIVLREAVSADELRSWLHGPTLIRQWPALNLSRDVRRAWERRHPGLRVAAAA